MSTVKDGRSETVALAAGDLLTVIAVTGAGRVTRLDTVAGYAAVTGTSLIGPFAVPTVHRIEALNGDMTYSAGPVDFPSAAEALAAAIGAIPVFALVGTVGDLQEIVGAGVPVDYTDGTPPATGEGTAGIGSRYTDVTNGKLYINGGTKAQPLWKLVTSAT